MHPIFAQLYKVDEERRLIYARAASEEVDNSGEMFDYGSSKPYFQEWSAATYRDTAGKSLGNVRSMHSPIAAGKLTDIQFLDQDQAIDVALKVVDDQEWDKVLEGVYTGLSIGGRYVRKWTDTLDGQQVTRYTAKPSEISLVDKPCMPSSKFIEVLKRDGTVARVPFRRDVYNELDEVLMRLEKRDSARKDWTQPASATSGIASHRTGKRRGAGKADLGDREDIVDDTSQAMPQASEARGSRRIARPRPKPAVEEVDNLEPERGRSGSGGTDTTKVDDTACDGDELEKGAYSVSSLASILANLEGWARSYAVEQAMEGEEGEQGNDVGEQVQVKVAELLELLAECAEEEARELRDGVEVDAVPFLMAEQAEGLVKRIQEIRKAGARHSKADKSLLNKLHDTAVELGADCGAAKVKQVGKSNEETEMKVVKSEPGGVAAVVIKAVLEALKKGGIETEGPKRGSTVGSDKDTEHSSNEERDPEEGTMDGSAGEDNPKSGRREKTRRGVGKAAKPGDDDDGPGDGDGEDDGADDDDGPPPKVKGKKAAAKAEDATEGEDAMTKAELMELVAGTVVATLQGLGVVQKAEGGDKGGDESLAAAAAPRRRPALFAVGKADDGQQLGGQAQGGDPLDVALSKSLSRPILKNDGTIDQPSSLIKLIHGRPPQQRVTAESLVRQD